MGKEKKRKSWDIHRQGMKWAAQMTMYMHGKAQVRRVHISQHA